VAIVTEPPQCNKIVAVRQSGFAFCSSTGSLAMLAAIRRASFEDVMVHPSDVN
jgi:hypothetical protein